MTVKEFLSFCKIYNVAIEDSYNGKIYKKLDKYMDIEVSGFYPRFVVPGQQAYTPYSTIQIVAWVNHYDIIKCKEGGNK